MNMITSKVVKVTPELAKLFLSKNSVNREVRNNNVKFFCNEIRTGSFKTTHQGIALSKEGMLLDGQHRLLAIIETNMPVEMLVTENLDSSTFHAMDCGAGRSISDRTGLDKKTAEVTKYLIRLTFSSNNISKSANNNIILAKAGIADLHNELMSYTKTTKKVFSCTQVRSAAIIMVLDGSNKDYVFSMYKNLVLQKFDELPSIAHCFIRQNGDKDSTGFGFDILAKSMKVFDEQYKDLTRLLCVQSDIDSALSRTKRIVTKLITENN